MDAAESLPIPRALPVFRCCASLTLGKLSFPVSLGKAQVVCSGRPEESGNQWSASALWVSVLPQSIVAQGPQRAYSEGCARAGLATTFLATWRFALEGGGPPQNGRRGYKHSYHRPPRVPNLFSSSSISCGMAPELDIHVIRSDDSQMRACRRRTQSPLCCRWHPSTLLTPLAESPSTSSCLLKPRLSKLTANSRLRPLWQSRNALPLSVSCVRPGQETCDGNRTLRRVTWHLRAILGGDSNPDIR